jgi:hypothetical protein
MQTSGHFGEAAGDVLPVGGTLAPEFGAAEVAGTL